MTVGYERYNGVRGPHPAQHKQQCALDLPLAGHASTAVAAMVGVRRETIWRWTQDPAFAAEVSRRQAERRQAIHSELDAGVLEAVQMFRGLMAGPEAPAGAHVRAASAMMDRAGLPPAYAVEVHHRADQKARRATEVQDPEVRARPTRDALP
jgi:hypothetical protein